MAEQWLSIVEYARTFALSDMTVRRRIKNGKIKAVLKEGKYYIPVTGEKLMASHPHPQPARVEARPVVRERAPQPIAQPVSRPYIEPKINERDPYHDMRPAPVQSQVSHFTLPESLARSVSQHEHTLIASQQLLNFCHNALKRQESLEKQIEQKFAARIEALESALHAKEAELAHHKQQIEDLQLLVKVFERKQASDL